MTENQLEAFLQKMKRIGLQPGNYSLFSDVETMGYINLVFCDKDVDEYLSFQKYLHSQLSRFKISIQFTQVQSDKVDFILIVECEPAIILNIRNIPCKPDSANWFFKKQPIDKPLVLFSKINETPEVFSRLIDNDPNAEFHNPVHIHLWKGLPLGTSSGDLQSL